MVRNILGQLNWLQKEQRFSVDTNSPDVLLGSQKIKKTVLSTTVAELYFFMKCFGSCQFLRGLWMDISGQVTNVHMRELKQRT